MGNMTKGLPSGVPQKAIPTTGVQPGASLGIPDTPEYQLWQQNQQQTAPTAPVQPGASSLVGPLGALQSGLQNQEAQGRQAMANAPQMVPMNMPQIPQFSPEQLGGVNLGPYTRKRK